MAENTNVIAVPLCKCGRAPHRKGQRNCHFCNRDANRKYRQSLKRMEARLNLLGAAPQSLCAKSQLGDRIRRRSGGKIS